MLNTMVITNQIKHQKTSLLQRLERCHNQYDSPALNMRDEENVQLL